jgi:mono/diheme cytochrome c family protein
VSRLWGGQSCPQLPFRRLFRLNETRRLKAGGSQDWLPHIFLGLSLLLLPAAAFAQSASMERGAQLYRTTCAVPYCHGPEGTAGRAPKLIGHTHTINSMFKVVTWGIPGTGMPEFTSRLKSEEIADIVAYVMTMRGTAPALVVTAPRAITPEAREGRGLFFDNNRSRACGTCHELDGWGVTVGPELKARSADLRRVPQTRVRTARAPGESPFPALLVEQTATRIRVYDLTAPLPVLRTFAAGQLAMSPGASWRHEDTTGSYSGAEIQKIAKFVDWATGVH